MSPKRQWTLATVAVVAGVVGFAVFRNEPKDDLPRLVVVRQEQVEGQKVVVLRLDGGRHRRLRLVTMSTIDAFTGDSPGTGGERKPLLAAVGNVRYEISTPTARQSRDCFLRPPLDVAAGRSVEFKIVPPPEDVWWLHCHVEFESTGVRSLRTRVAWCWAYKSLRPFGRWMSDESGIVESELITNATPRTLEAPRPP